MVSFRPKVSCRSARTICSNELHSLRQLNFQPYRCPEGICRSRDASRRHGLQIAVELQFTAQIWPTRSALTLPPTGGRWCKLATLYPICNQDLTQMGHVLVLQIHSGHLQWVGEVSDKVHFEHRPLTSTTHERCHMLWPKVSWQLPRRSWWLLITYFRSEYVAYFIQFSRREVYWK